MRCLRRHIVGVFSLDFRLRMCYSNPVIQWERLKMGAVYAGLFGRPRETVARDGGWWDALLPPPVY